MTDTNFTGTDMVGLLSKKIGDIVVQATITESHDDTLKITSHPVESGPMAARRSATMPSSCRCR